MLAFKRISFTIKLLGSISDSQLIRIFKIISDKENNFLIPFYYNCKYLSAILSSAIIPLMDETKIKKQKFRRSIKWILNTNIFNKKYFSVICI